MVKNGKYTLRASPVAGVGGMLATGHGSFKIVTVAALGPEGKQTWVITAVEDKEDVYTIVLFRDDKEISLGESWSLENGVVVPNGPIITAEVPDEWHITPTDNDIEDTYHIRPVNTDKIGVNYYVGTDHENRVVIKEFPFHPPPLAGEIPYWQIN